MNAIGSTLVPVDCCVSLMFFVQATVSFSIIPNPISNGIKIKTVHQLNPAGNTAHETALRNSVGVVILANATRVLRYYFKEDVSEY